MCTCWKVVVVTPFQEFFSCLLFWFIIYYLYLANRPRGLSLQCYKYKIMVYFKCFSTLIVQYIRDTGEVWFITKNSKLQPCTKTGQHFTETPIWAEKSLRPCLSSIIPCNEIISVNTRSNYFCIWKHETP